MAADSCFHLDDSVDGIRVLDRFLVSRGLVATEPDASEPRVHDGQVAQDCMYLAFLHLCRTRGLHFVCKPTVTVDDENFTAANGFPTVPVLRWVAAYFTFEIYRDPQNVFHALFARLMQSITSYSGPFSREHTAELVLDRWKERTMTTGVCRAGC